MSARIVGDFLGRFSELERLSGLCAEQTPAAPADMPFIAGCEKFAREDLKMDGKLCDLDRWPAMRHINSIVPTTLDEARKRKVIIRFVTRESLGYACFTHRGCDGKKQWSTGTAKWTAAALVAAAEGQHTALQLIIFQNCGYSDLRTDFEGYLDGCSPNSQHERPPEQDPGILVVCGLTL